MSEQEKRLIRNIIECVACGDVIESVHRHDFKTCKCGSVSIYGGKSYQRWLWPSGAPHEWIRDRSVWEELPELPLNGKDGYELAA